MKTSCVEVTGLYPSHVVGPFILQLLWKAEHMPYLRWGGPCRWELSYWSLTLGFLFIDSCSSLVAKVRESIYTGCYDAAGSCWCRQAGNACRPINTRLVDPSLWLLGCSFACTACSPCIVLITKAGRLYRWDQNDRSGLCPLPDVMIRASQQIFNLI